MLSSNTPSRREALDELLECVQQIEALQRQHELELASLTFKRDNLRKIVLGETVAPEPPRQKHRLTRHSNRAPTGATREAVLKALHENGGWMACGDIAKATGIDVSTISVCLRRGMPEGFVNTDRTDARHFKYSVAVRGEPRMLNHA